MPNAREHRTGPRRFRSEDSDTPLPRQGRHRAGVGRHRAGTADWRDVLGAPARYAAGAIAVTVEATAGQRRRVAHLALTGMAVAAATGVVQVPAMAAETSPPPLAAQTVARDVLAATEEATRSTTREEPAEPMKHPEAQTLDDVRRDPEPVAGLDKRQMANAVTIVRTGQDMGLPERAWVVALMTAMQESRLYNLASYAVPESLDYDHQGTGADHDSIGLFQQRASGNWGSVEQIMNPEDSARAFFTRLQTVPGWQSLALTYAAQAVQISAFPDAYAPHESVARAVVEAMS